MAARQIENGDILVAWRFYIALFLAVIVADQVGRFVPSLNLGMPFGLEGSIVAAVIVTVMLLIFERIGL